MMRTTSHEPRIMLEIALYFERISTRLNPVVLIGPGLICVVVGLFIWLGGLGYRRFLAAVAGAVSGAVCGFFITGRNAVLAAIAAAVSCLIAVIFERIFITILAAGLAAVFGFAVLARPYIIENAGSLRQSAEYDMQNKAEPFSLSLTVEFIEAWTADFSDQIKQICSLVPAYNWVIIAVLVVIFIVAGILLWRLISALCCAALGTLLIFCGMILLLLYKGSVPISYINQRQAFYLSVFLTMMAFGTCVQLLFCQRAGVKQKAKNRKSKNEQEREEKYMDWRTR